MEEIETQVNDHVLVITINRPSVRNAVNGAVAEGMAAALDRLDADPELRVGVVTGAGGTFCSGMDLAAFSRGEAVRVPGRGFAGITRYGSSKPLIAAVEGYALAGGFEVALSCDLIVAAGSATFGLPEVRRGLTPAAGGALRLPGRIPYHAAMDILLTGDRVGAERMAALGVVTRLTGDGEALAEALGLAGQLVDNAPLSLKAVKQIVTEAPSWPVNEWFDRQEDITSAVAASNDAKEGARAFVEKRAPEWSAT